AMRVCSVAQAPSTTANYTLSLHDALPICPMIMSDLGAEVIKVEPVTGDGMRLAGKPFFGCQRGKRDLALNVKDPRGLEIALDLRSEEHTSELQSRENLVCRLLLEKKECQQ